MNATTSTLISDYKKHLMDAFFYIARDPTINKCAGIAGSSFQVYGKLKSCPNNSWTFQIIPPWIIPIMGKKGYFENDQATLVIGGEISVTDCIFSKYNFFVSIVRNHNNSENDRTYDSCCEEQKKCVNRIVRRFHFDTGAGKEFTLETNSHIQFGGLCHEKGAVEKYYGKPLHYCLDNKLDTPRIPHPPLDIILIFDLIIRQFETAVEREFVEKSEWINLVRGSEDFRLRKYYDQIEKYYKNKTAKHSKYRKTLFETMCDKDFEF